MTIEERIYIPKQLNKIDKVVAAPAVLPRPTKSMVCKEPLICKKTKNYDNFLSNGDTKPDDSAVDKINASPEKKKVVLVTDDAFYNRMVMKEMLKKFNVLAIEANNGEEAASIVEKSFTKQSEYEITLVLMDLSMPIMSGVEATLKIRQIEKDNERKEIIPIVAVTAHDSTKDRVGCLQAGMQEFQLKPVTSKQLENLLKKYAASLINKT